MANFYPLKSGGIYLVRNARYTGSPWQANVTAVTDACYLINTRWYLKDDFERQYIVFEEIELTIDGYRTKKPTG